MRLLSFLTDIERAIVAESPAVDGGSWNATRMVNFEKGLGRLTLESRAPTETPVPGGAILLQAFLLSDGSQCLKATLNWKNSDAVSTVAVYSTPTLNWTLEASRVASTWLEGPPAAAASTDSSGSGQRLEPLSAAG